MAPRLALTLGLLLTVALLAGCSSAPVTAPEAAEAPMPVPAEVRTSVVPPEPETRPETRLVDLESFDLVGSPGVEHVMGVTIPDDAVFVRATLTIHPGAVQELRVDLGSCNLMHVPSASAVAFVDIIGDCDAPAAGLQQAVLVFEAGAFAGTLAFQAGVPV